MYTAFIVHGVFTDKTDQLGETVIEMCLLGVGYLVPGLELAGLAIIDYSIVGVTVVSFGFVLIMMLR